eukprot:gene271-9919_t
MALFQGDMFVKRFIAKLTATLVITSIVANAVPIMQKQLDDHEMPDEWTTPGICKGPVNDPDWLPACRPNGYFALEQCNRQGNLCWCSDLLGNKMSHSMPKNRLECHKPCFLRQTDGLFTPYECDKDGNFIQTPDTINGGDNSDLLFTTDGN